MTNRIEITAEMVKLAQQRSRSTGGDVRQEIARLVVSESIWSLDPELGLLIDEEHAFSREDSLVSAFDVNDVVVNGVRYDVRLIGEDGRVCLPRNLVVSSYMSSGTLAVVINPDRTASVASFIPRADWDLQDKHIVGSEDKVMFRPERHADLDLGNLLAKLSPTEINQRGATAPTSAELVRFVANKLELPQAQQQQIVDAVLSCQESWKELSVVLSSWSKPVLRKTLTHAAVWNQKLDRIAERVQPRFTRLSREEIKTIIARVGEQFGGQPDAPAFRKEILNRLTREELTHMLKGSDLRKASAIAEQVLSGRTVTEAIQEFVGNKQMVEIATAIKSQRQKMANFVEATSDELSIVFRQLALQPVYATHSQSQEGIDSINEALKLLDACDLAQRVAELEKELVAEPVV